MKKILVKILIICVAIFLQANVALAQNKIKTEKITGEIIAYHQLSGWSCFDICILSTIVKLEKPINNQQLIQVDFGFIQDDFPKELVSKKQKVIVKAFQLLNLDSQLEEFVRAISTTGEPMKSHIKQWRLLKGAENEIIPYGTTISWFVSAEPLDKILKRSDTNE
jgi:hypothetical protein